MANSDLVVATPLVIAHTPRGDVYVSQGASLPDDTDPAQLQMLQDEKQVVDRESYEGQQALVGPYVAPIPDQPDPPKGAQTEDQSLSGPADDGADGGKPAKRDGVDAWRDYAKAQGMPAADADAATKAELVDKYAG